MPRVTTAFVSDFQRDRVHRSDFYRGESRIYSAEFRAVIPEAQAIAYVEWRCDRPDVTIMSDATCDSHSSAVTLLAGSPGLGTMKAQAVLTDGSVVNQMFVVGVNPSPWYTGESGVVTQGATYLRAEYNQGPGKTFIISGKAPNGSVGFYFQYDYAYTGGREPITWGLNGSPPIGLSIDNTGRLYGTPTVSGSYSFNVQAQSSDGQFSSINNTIIINSATLMIVGKLSNGSVGIAYSSSLSTVGGEFPFIWSIDSGSLPPGLFINSSNGIISGTPTS